MKRNIIQQRISGPFTLLLYHKPICQVEITLQRQDIAHTHQCIIPFRITCQKLRRRPFLLEYQVFNNTSVPDGEILTFYNIMKILFHHQLRQKWGKCFTTPKKVNQSDPPLSKWATHNSKHSCRQIILPRMEQKMTTSIKSTKDMDIWFYWLQDIIHKGHYNMLWKSYQLIWLTVLPNTSHIAFIVKYAQCI